MLSVSGNQEKCTKTKMLSLCRPREGAYKDMKVFRDTISNSENQFSSLEPKWKKRTEKNKTKKQIVRRAKKKKIQNKQTLKVLIE